MMFRIKEAKDRNAEVIDVDGSYLHRKHQQLINSGVSVAPPGVPPRPLAGWETITNSNYQQYCTKIPIVTQGLIILFNISIIPCMYRGRVWLLAQRSWKI